MNTCSIQCSIRGLRAGQSSARAGPLRLPDWQLVPGTKFVVDKFGSKAYEAAPSSKHWFLTHFHADHYGGLGPRFKQGLTNPDEALMVLMRILAISNPCITTSCN